MKKFLLTPVILTLSILLGSSFPSKVTHIALFGFDQSSLESIMIFSYNVTNREVFLTAIATDALLPTQTTLKETYSQGGIESSLSTLSDNLKVDIDKYVAIDFQAIEDLVNRVDGIQLKIQANEIKHIPSLDTLGTQTLNGSQAIAYSKIKLNHLDYFGQMKRQQKAVAVLGKKLKTYSKLKLLSLLYDFSPSFETNINLNEMITLSSQLVFGNNAKLVQLQIPNSELFDFNENNVLPNAFNENLQQWRDTIY